MLLSPEYMSFYHARIRRALLIEFSSALCSEPLAWAGVSSGCFDFSYAQVAERGFSCGLVLAAGDTPEHQVLVSSSLRKARFAS